ncbi:MAG TPA: hypothetical protein VM802_03315 [Chitinophaga sp.]|uniref:hypothetical protein n=1 Tax=Chitinophaga sp. TaxID=1869181 RepID=UPI002CE98F45|nr:hypothetical protein [Chitinophaga sp.]HVI43864.1 hypothetical protein [Chitinophaga sp.]
MNQENEQVWLIASLFCLKSNWQELLSSGIQPFLCGLSENHQIDSFRVILNESRGENIRLSILAPQSLGGYLAGYTDSYFKQYFQDKKFQAQPGLNTEVERAIFMPFPENSIQYGLYAVAVDEDFVDLRYKAMPWVLTEGLSADEVDKDAIVTFGFYLHLSTLKALMIIDRNASQTITSYHQSIVADAQQNIKEEQLHKNIAENWHCLHQMAEDVFPLEHGNENVFPWLLRWEDTIISEFEKIPQTKDGITSGYVRISNLINSSLSLNKSDQILISCYMVNIIGINGPIDLWISLNNNS